MQAIINNPLLLGFIVLSMATLVLLSLVIWMWLKLRKFLIGIDSADISQSLTFVSSGLEELKSFRKELESYLIGVEKRLKKSVQSVHTVRFNPFHGTATGSNQSFATAFLNEDGDGVVISSLYSRDHVSIFAKPVNKHASEHEMSEEEKQAMEEAKKNLK